MRSKVGGPRPERHQAVGAPFFAQFAKGGYDGAGTHEILRDDSFAPAGRAGFLSFNPGVRGEGKQ